MATSRNASSSRVSEHPSFRCYEVTNGGRSCDKQNTGRVIWRSGLQAQGSAKKGVAGDEIRAMARQGEAGTREMRLFLSAGERSFCTVRLVPESSQLPQARARVGYRLFEVGAEMGESELGRGFGRLRWGMGWLLTRSVQKGRQVSQKLGCASGGVLGA